MPALPCRKAFIWAIVSAVMCMLMVARPSAFAQNTGMDNYHVIQQFDGESMNKPDKDARGAHPQQPGKPTGNQQNYGGPAGGGYQAQNQSKETQNASRTAQTSGQETVGKPPQPFQYSGIEGSTAGMNENFIQTPQTFQNIGESNVGHSTLNNLLVNGTPTPTGNGGGSLDLLNDDSLFPKGKCCSGANGLFDPLNPPPCCKVNGIFDPFGMKPPCCQLPKKNNKNNGGGGGGGIQPPMFQPIGALHTLTNGSVSGVVAAAAAAGAAIAGAAPDAKANQAAANGQAKQGSRASSAGEDALKDLYFMIEDYTQYLINVANEDAGGGGGAHSLSKTYADVAGMVQKMYKRVYLPLAILFLLPGAVATQAKGLVSFQMLSSRDDDTTTPWVGLMRAVIAIFLIPTTQLAVSYMIDVGNACESVVNKYASMPLILLWVEEQIVVFSPDQQGKLIKNIPNIPMSPLAGKFAGMPIKGAVMEQVSGLDAALAEICNESLHMLSLAMSVMSAFQLALVCYLFLVGPLVAAFFAWPGVGRELFRRAFSSWLDGVVMVTLWKFWWVVVLAAWTTWLEAGGINPFDPMGPYWLIAWMSILISVPFNPFEFKPGEVIQNVLAKAEAVAAKVAQGGKGGGSGGGGKAKGGPPGGGGC